MDAMAMQSKVEAKEKEVEELLKKIDKRERQNVADMIKLISGMDSATGTTMLLSLDETLAARILAGMNKKTASQLLSEALGGKNPDKAKAEAMKNLTRKMQALSDELKENAK